MKRRDFLREIKKYGYTQKSFATLIGYSEITIKKWEDGKIPVWIELVLNYLELIHNAEQKGLLKK